MAAARIRHRVRHRTGRLRMAKVVRPARHPAKDSSRRTRSSPMAARGPASRVKATRSETRLPAREAIGEIRRLPARLSRSRPMNLPRQRRSSPSEAPAPRPTSASHRTGHLAGPPRINRRRQRMGSSTRRVALRTARSRSTAKSGWLRHSGCGAFPMTRAVCCGASFSTNTGSGHNMPMPAVDNHSTDRPSA